MKPHFHENEKGSLVRCYHECRKLLLSWQFWVGTTLSFPLEHLVWRIWPLSIIADWIGV